ncbi:MAG: hypothetical protein IJQ00_05755 [Kiritimatiellae bacterium]|nr:hypothetical protein [Kiritimatiellia bacterium]
MRRGGFGAGALLSAVLGAMLSGAVNATDLSSMPVVSGTLTISAPGEYVVDGDVQCTTLAITAEGAVTFVNPSAGETNTIHVESVTSVANASAAFNCKVAFDAAYNVAAEGPVTFAGGAAATAPGTTSGAYGNVLSGDITFTANWTLPAGVAYTVPSGAKVSGIDVSGGNGSHVEVKEGGAAYFKSVTLASTGLKIEVFGELDVEGWCTCNATVNYTKFPSDTFSTGLVRVGGLKRTGGNVADLFNANAVYIGANGIRNEGSQHPDWYWFHESDAVYHAYDDFAIHGSTADHGFCLFDATATFNTHGHVVTWTAKINGNNSAKIVKDGDGVLEMRPNGIFGNNAANIKTMPIEVRGGVFRQGNAIITGPITARSGATLAVADGVTIANAITLEAGATLEFGSGAVVGGAVTWPEGDIYICAKETGILIPSGVTDEVLARMSLSPASVGGTLEVVDGALVFTSDNRAVYTWKGGVDGRYSTAGNWLLDRATAVSAPGAQDVALFVPSSNVVVVLDGDAAIAELRVFGYDSVTFVNPSAAETNTIRMVRMRTGEGVNTTFNCKVAFDAAYNMTAESAVTFAGGVTATAPAPGTTSGAYGNVLKGDISFTSAWVLPASAAYTVPPGSRVTGMDVSGGNGSSILVEEGGVAKFASATLGTRGLRITVHGELEIDGWCTCYATDDLFALFPSETLSTGVVRAGGFKRTGDKVVQGINANDVYIGAYGLYEDGSGSRDWFWFQKTDAVYHATADFAIAGSSAKSAFVIYAPFTVNTHGHTVTWTAKMTGGNDANNNGMIVKEGDGVFVMQPAGMVNAGNATSIKTIPIEVRGGTFRQGNAITTGPVTVRGGGTFEVVDNLAAPNAVTLEAGAVLALGAGGSVAGSISTPATGTATVKPHGDFSGLTGWKASATLGVLAADADVSALSLDATGIVLPRGWQAKLMRSNDNLDMVFSKSGMVVIVK